MKIFKIRNTKTGLYSLGTQSPTWGKKGKIWATSSALSNHFNLVGHELVPKVYQDCEIVEYEIIETEVKSLSLVEWSAALQERSQKAKLIERKKILEKQAARAKELADRATKELQIFSNKKGY